MVGVAATKVLTEYRTELAQLISLPEFLQFPVPAPFL